MDTNVNNKKPLVSVIMAAYNTEKYIAEAIESVLSQTYSNWELVIADDASTDTTADIVDRYARQDGRIKMIRLDKNSGQAIARNKAIEKSMGKYLAILDADDVSLPDRLLKQVEFLESNTDISLVGSSAELIDEAGKAIGTKRKPLSNKEIRFRLLLQTQFTASTVCTTKSAFMEVGGFDTKYLYAEDYDLWSRLVKKGEKLANIAQPLVLYRMHSNSVSRKTETQKIQEQNALDVNARNVAPFITIPRKNLVNMVNMNNNRQLSIFQIIDALKWYRRLVQGYVVSDVCTKTEAVYVKNLYCVICKHVIKIKIKRLLHI